MDKLLAKEEIEKILTNNTQIVTEYIGGDNTPFVVAYFDNEQSIEQIYQLFEDRIKLRDKEWIEEIDNFIKWLEGQNWDTTRSAFIVSKIVLKRRVEALKSKMEKDL